MYGLQARQRLVLNNRTMKQTDEPHIENRHDSSLMRLKEVGIHWMNGCDVAAVQIIFIKLDTGGQNQLWRHGCAHVGGQMLTGSGPLVVRSYFIDRQLRRLGDSDHKMAQWLSGVGESISLGTSQRWASAHLHFDGKMLISESQASSQLTSGNLKGAIAARCCPPSSPHHSEAVWLLCSQSREAFVTPTSTERPSSYK